MLQIVWHSLFGAWERRLASATTDRVVRPFEWGLDWIPQNGNRVDPAAEQIGEWVLQVMKNTDEFFTPPPTRDYALTARAATGDRTLTFPSAFPTPHRENNTVYARYFHARTKAPRAAVLVLPQWNADDDGHVGLCRLLTWSGLSALRLSLPYHHRRMPPELHRADYIVSSNVARTVQVCRQAVLDARRAIAWLA
jgi:hypothetical protein